MGCRRRRRLPHSRRQHRPTWRSIDDGDDGQARLHAAHAALRGTAGALHGGHAEGSWVYGHRRQQVARLRHGHRRGEHRPLAIPRSSRPCRSRPPRCRTRRWASSGTSPCSTWPRRCTEILPEGMDQVMFQNSGAEAVENAVKLAKQATRRPGVIAFQGAFHGRTHLTMALTARPCTTAATWSRSWAASITPATATRTARRPVRTRRRTRSRTSAACCAPRSSATTWPRIIVEPIQGEGGFVVPTAEFMQGLRAIADEIGACSSSTRSRPAWAAPASGSATSTTASSRTS